MESKRKNVYITIFVITTIIASCAAVYFYLKATNNKLVAGNKESEVASQENQTTTNVDVAKEEVKEKIVYKNVMPELDPAKCIEGSKDGGTYSFRVADSFGTDFNAYLGDDKKTVDITLNVEEINKMYYLNKSSNDFSYPIKIKFDKEISDLCISSLGFQAVGYEILLILLKDGTVEFIPLYDAIKNNNIKSYGKIEGITDIARIGSVEFRGSEGGGFGAPCAIKSDGSFYDLSNRLSKFVHPFN